MTCKTEFTFLREKFLRIKFLLLRITFLCIDCNINLKNVYFAPLSKCE